MKYLGRFLLGLSVMGTIASLFYFKDVGMFVIASILVGIALFAGAITALAIGDFILYLCGRKSIL